MKGISILSLLVVAITCGCDPATGVIRTVKLAKAPSNQAVESALRDLPEVKNFEHQAQKGADTWSTRDGKFALEIRKAKNGGAILELRSLKFGSSTLGEWDTTRKLMDEVYASLHREAPDLPPPTGVTEKLLRVRSK